METIVLLAQTVLTGFLGAWLFLGARDNLLYPEMNQTYTAEVMQLARMREEYPEHYRVIAHRRVTNERWHRAVFWIIAAAEVMVCLFWWARHSGWYWRVWGWLTSRTPVSQP